MSTATARFTLARIRCHWRPVIMVGAGLTLLGLFWFASRYPQLFSKAEHVGEAQPSMAYSRQLMTVAADAPGWLRILAATVNWLDSMKIGMTFGVLFGALLHTVLRYYPLKIGKNLYLNSLKGALVGVPMGVCANCAVPTACGVTRGNGRIEVALGFLFSSPNFNPVVVMMTFMALPLAMGLTKYGVLSCVTLFVVPSLIRWLEREKPLPVFTVGDGGATCAIHLPPPDDCQEKFTTVFGELTRDCGVRCPGLLPSRCSCSFRCWAGRWHCCSEGCGVAEPVVAADGAGSTAFRGRKSALPAPLLNCIVGLPSQSMTKPTGRT
jgi:hypothetical protein